MLSMLPIGGRKLGVSSNKIYLPHSPKDVRSHTEVGSECLFRRLR